MNLRRSPRFFALAVVLLACGLAAVTILFTIADALLMKPLAAAKPDELVRFVFTWPQLGVRSYFRQEVAHTWRQHATSFTQLGTVHETSLSYRDAGRTERAQVAFTSPEWLQTFGVAAAFGHDQAALLSHQFWQRRYAGDAAVVGRKIEIHGQPFTIAGVLPAGFNGATVEAGPDVRVPHGALPRFHAAQTIQRDLEFEVVGRLKPGQSRETARQEAFRIYATNRHKEFDRELKAAEFDLEPLQYGASRLRAQTAGAVWFATGAAALLALMVCLNLSGLLLARVIHRQPEFAVRQALGATRGRLAVLVFQEVALVAVAATATAAALTIGGLKLIAAVLPPVRLLGRTAVPMALRLDPDWRILAFGAGAALLALCLVALAPAWRASRADLASTLRAARVTSTTSRRLLLVTQAALCTILLLAAALVNESLRQLRSHASPVPVINADVDRSLVPGLTEERFARVLEEWSAKVRALPGVQTAALSAIRRLRGSGLKMTIVPEGAQARPDQFMNSSTLPMGAAYLETNSIPILAGRQLTDAERYGKAKPAAVIASEAFARQYGGPQAILGRRFGTATPGQPAAGTMLVVGVAGNVVYRTMREHAAPVLYVPLGGVWDRMTLTVRTDLPAAALASGLRQALKEIEPALTVEEIQDIGDDVDAALWNERAVAFVATVFAVLATAIIAAGLFAFVAYLVATRRREVGIRIALGARPARILALILREGVAPVAIGIVIGLAGGAALTSLAQAFLYGVTPGEPLRQAAVAAALLATAIAACLMPAWRASQIAPSVALRAD